MENNIDIIYSLAEENFLLTAPPLIHSKVNCFLNKSVCKDFSKTLIKIEINIRSIDEIKVLVNSLKDNLKRCKICKLEVAQYFYDELNTIYILGSIYVGILNSKQKQVKWYVTETNVPSRNVFHIFVLDILSIVLPSVNKIVFHGASLRYENTAIALLGRSGNGKSTITRKLNECLLCSKNSDDTFIVSIAEQIKLYPINSGEGYEPDIADALLKKNINYSLLTDVRNAEKKYIINNKFDATPLELKSIYILNRETDSNSTLYTKIFTLLPEKAFLHMLNTQTNILTPYLKEKLALYKQIADRIGGNFVNFNFECDINMVIKDIRMKQ